MVAWCGSALGIDAEGGLRRLSDQDADLAAAAAILGAGGLVVVPTETVYGLAANALDEEAVRAIFEAKGRPSENPLILHVRTMEQARALASEWPESANRLAEAFWPGPLTLVVPAADKVPRVATGGLDTVGIRMPSHPVMRALLYRVDFPFAAPSANLFMGLSPTRAEDVSPELLARVDALIEGSDCAVGIESTVVAFDDQGVIILRPGGVSAAELSEVLGTPVRANGNTEERRSPGQYARHYAPRAPLRLVEKLDPDASGLTFGEPKHERQIEMPRDARLYGQLLYAALHALDFLEVEEIQVEMPLETAEWDAVWDRLRRAAE